MQNLSSSQSKLLDELISKITGFTLKSENFRTCRKFSVSNLCSHRYLDTDIYKVNQRIDGIIEKFNVHSATGQAKELRTCVDDFVKSPLVKDGYPSTQLHTDLLFFLLEMHTSPLHKTHEDTIPCQFNANALEMDGSEDWHALLMDNLDDMIRDDYNQESDTDSEYDSIRNESVNEPVIPPTNISNSMDLINVDINIDEAVAVTSHINEEKSSSLTAEMLQPEYWQSNDVVVKVNDRHKSMVRANWKSYLSKVDPAQASFTERLQLSEFQVLREVLWMLQGAEDSFLFEHQDNPHLATKNCVRLAKAVAVPHLTNGALDEYLQQFVKWGCALRCISSVCSYVAAADARDTLISKTISTFANQLSGFRCIFLDVVNSIEKRARGQETQTLITVYTELRPWFRRLSVVQDILLAATAGRFESLAWDTTAISLLDQTYDALCTLSMTGSDPWMLDYVKYFFVRTFEPYIYFLNVVLSGGEYQICGNEFFLKKNFCISPKDKNYWNDSYSLKYPEREKVFAAVPKVLHSFLPKLIITIKSMDLLKEIATESSLPNVVKDIICEPGHFITSFELQLLTNESETLNRHCCATSHPPQFQMGKYLLNDADDKLYVSIFQNLFLSMHQSPAFPQTNDFQRIDSTNANTYEQRLCLPPSQFIQVKIEGILDKMISERHCCITRKLVSVLLDDDKLALRRTLLTLRSVYLMEAGDTMYDFSWDVFHRMKYRDEAWCDSLFLNLRLREGLLEKFGDAARQFWILIDKDQLPKDADIFSLEGFLLLTLNYTVPWPLYFVITEETISKYNRVFQFLLQVKYAKFCLDQLSFSDIPVKAGASRTECFLLRHKLLHVINSLHQFTMVRIYSIRLLFDTQLASTKDISDIISVHNLFIDRVHRACLLDPATGQLRQALLNLLGLAIVLADVWTNASRGLNTTALRSTESKLDKYVDFLCGLFTEAVKRESLANLEPLAQAFLSFPT